MKETIPHHAAELPPQSQNLALRVAISAFCLLLMPAGSCLAGDPLAKAGVGNGAPAGSRTAAIRELITRDPSLWGYWPLAENLKAANNAPVLRSGKGDPVFRAGPLGGDSSIDLSNGAYLSLDPGTALDVPELTVELVAKAKYTNAGTLFGLRDGAATRFSLHYSAESSILKLWNGRSIVAFEADGPLKMNEWFHVALAVSASDVTLWINGKRCITQNAAGVSAEIKGLPLLVGTSDLATGKAERAEILAAHLAIYKSRLDDGAVAARVKALGWSGKLIPRPRRSVDEEIAMIDSRIGKIRKDHGVEVHYKYSHKEFIPAVWHSVGKGTQLPFGQVPRVLDEIESFLAVVPASVSRKELEGIYLFDDLKIGGGGMGAMAYGKSIYLCCVRPTIDIRYSIYHEFSHILQVAYPVDHEAWAALRPQDFKYGERTKLNPFGFDDNLRSAGFIINYSTTNQHEEIAVLSDYLFVRKDETMDLTERYPAIRRKVAALAKYYQTISPEYDLSFYGKILPGAAVIHRPAKEK
jgi:hypothetical protein